MVDQDGTQGNFLTPVNVASALFFESPPDLFRRVHREIRPRTPVPDISVEYKRFANANSDVRLDGGAIRVRITDLLESAPAPVIAAAKPQPAAVAKKTTAPLSVIAAKPTASKPAAKTAPPAETKISAKGDDPVKSIDASKTPKPEEKKWAMSGKRDPFFSPVVQQSSGSGCSTGKKCLEIGQINLRGVVKSESGFIAIVTNSLNKAYFLRENDPVFNGYVVRITGDAVVFQETVQDKLGKPLTREVTKRIFTPAV